MRFLIADDHAIVRKGLAQMLLEKFPDSQITEVSNSAEVFKHLRDQIWDILLLDISMPGQNGIEVLKQIRANENHVPILIISTHPEEQYALRTLKAGASGFLNKECPIDELLKAIYRVLSGKKYISASLTERLAETLGEKMDHTQLSDREMQVLQFIASGKTVSQIALDISLSVNTISTYRARILEKLNLKNNSELTRYALDHKLI